jgi:hypothetical protein
VGRKKEPLTVKIAYTHIEEGKEPYYTYEKDYTAVEIQAHFLSASEKAMKAIGYVRKNKKTETA